MTCDVIRRERPGIGPPPVPSRTSLVPLASLSAACTSSTLLTGRLSAAPPADARAGTATMPASRLRRVSLLDVAIMGIPPSVCSPVPDPFGLRRELLQDLVSLRHRIVEALLGRLFTAEDVLHLLLDDVADGDGVPEPVPLAVGRRLAGVHLVDGGLLIWVLRVVAGHLHRPGGGIGERQISRHPRPPSLVLGGGDVFEELRDAPVLFRLGALHDPQRGAAEYRVPLREAREPRQEPGSPRELPL